MFESMSQVDVEMGHLEPVNVLMRLIEGVRTAIFYEDVPVGYLTCGIVNLERAERDGRVWWWVHGWRRVNGGLEAFSERRDTFSEAMALVEEATRRTLPALEDTDARDGQGAR